MRIDNYYTLVKPKHCLLRNYCCDVDNPEICKFPCKRGDNMNYLLAMANIPDVYRNNQCLDIDKIENRETISFLQYLNKNLLSFVADGYSAYFYGPSGTGKTSWAVAILLKYLRLISIEGTHRTGGIYIDTQKLLHDFVQYNGKTNAEAEGIIRDLKTCPLVIWDNFLPESAVVVTAAETAFLHSLINERYLNGLANIYTSTTEPQRLSLFGVDIYNKVGKGSAVVQFSGADLHSYYTFKDRMKDDPDVIPDLHIFGKIDIDIDFDGGAE